MRSIVKDFSWVFGAVLSLFLFTKIEKNIAYLVSKHLPAPFLPTYFALNLFDLLLPIFFLYCLFKKFPLGSYLKEHKALLFLGLFTLWMRLSLFQVDPLFLERTQVLFFTFLGAVLCFPLFAHPFFQRKIHQNFPPFLILLITFSSFQCFVGLFQFLFQKPLGLFFLGEFKTLAASIDGSLSSLWIGKILHLDNASTMLTRSYGTMSHPNILGGFLAIGSFALYFLFESIPKQPEESVFDGVGFSRFFRLFGYTRSLIQKTLLATLLFFHMLTLFTTFSRSSLVSFAFLTLAFGIYHYKTIFKTALPPLILLFGLANFLLLGAPLAERTTSLPVSGKTLSLHSNRMKGYWVAEEMVKAHPFLGIGYKQFVNQVDAYTPPKAAFVEKLSAHNIYLLIAAESGLVGLTLFLLFLFFVGKERGKSLSSFFFLASIGSMLLVGLFDCYLITSFFWRMTFFAFLGLLETISSIRLKNKSANNNESFDSESREARFF